MSGGGGANGRGPPPPCCKSSTAPSTSRTTTRGVYGLLVVSRYLLIGPDGRVLALDKMDWRDDGRFVARLPDHLDPGDYTVLAGIFLDGNPLGSPVAMLRVRAGPPAPPG